ncbi:MAG: response regulator [Ignavibacteria bacterium]|nr:MAG: response regulator [Ignavibacteria bacterium]
MQSAKIDFLSKYNDLVNSAFTSAKEFPDNLCDFLVNEYEFEAVVLTAKVNDTEFEILGKSSHARKSYTSNSFLKCNVCTQVINDSTETRFEFDNGCEFTASDVMMNEGCLYISISHSERVLLKIAKKSEFTQNEVDNIIVIGNSLRNLLKLWMSKKGGLSNTLGNIITSIGHELRTPTNSILGFASLLNEEKLSPSQGEYVDTLKENAYDLLSILNDLIEIAKLDIGESKTTLTVVNVSQFIKDILRLIEEKVDKSRIDFIVNIDEGIPESLNLDAQKLRYILLNIINTAVRFTEQGKVTVSAFSTENNRLSFRITDTSSGIPSDKLENVFAPFTLNDFIVQKIGNTTGLSLTLVKRYIDYLNGEIEITSTLGKGTSYYVSIPVEKISEVETQISGLPKPSKTNKVLVIEDDYATSKLLSNYLQKWGYEPTIVNSAKQTLQIVEKETFLAILMDIVLPDSSGLELLQKLREIPQTKRTPVIICSVEAEQQKAFLMGAIEYFVKPINYKYLVEVLTHYKLRKDSNVLIVDDDVPTLNLLKEAVQQAGLNAIAESHSSKVMGMIENIDLDLAIIDLDMPEIDGFDLIKLIKSKPNFTKLPIIIYTGKENYADDLQKIDGLFEDLLLKSSTNIEDLQNVVSAMIDRYEEPSTPEEVKEKKDTVKILLVEDYKHSQIIVTRLLKKNKFESIVVVENGQEALDEVKVQKYDLILMDMQMPVMNGFEATQKIRQLDEYKDTPIVALTAFAMKGDREKCLEAGATDYIAKPIDSIEFIEKVKYYTEKKETVQEKR